MRKVWNSIKAAFTSPEAVKAEKSLAALVVVRLVITLGGTAAFADLLVKLIEVL